jgi:hypothetical protein
MVAILYVVGIYRLEFAGVGGRNPITWEDDVFSPILGGSWDFLPHPLCHPWSVFHYTGLPVEHITVPGDPHGSEDTGHGWLSNFLNVDFEWQKVVILSAHPSAGGKPLSWHVGWDDSYCNIILAPSQKIGMLIGKGDADFFAIGDNNITPLSLRIEGYATRTTIPNGVVFL